MIARREELEGGWWLAGASIHNLTPDHIPAGIVSGGTAMVPLYMGAGAAVYQLGVVAQQLLCRGLPLDVALLPDGQIDFAATIRAKATASGRGWRAWSRASMCCRLLRGT
jgi:hypothetical protein